MEEFLNSIEEHWVVSLVLAMFITYWLCIIFKRYGL